MSKKTNVKTDKKLNLFKNLSLQQFADYCKFFAEHDLVELSLNIEDVKIELRSELGAAGAPSAAPPLSSSLALATSLNSVPPPHGTQLVGGASAPVPVKEAAAPAVAEKTIRAPMTGAFYASPTPTSPPYVKVGAKVSKGQKICILEAMKIMNEIESSESGTVKAVLVKNGEAVAKGAVLFTLAEV